MSRKAFTLLVVDDDRRLRDLLEKYLMEQGFWVVTAESAKEARKRLKENKIDLIILDVMMPGESGLEFTQKWRAGEGGQESNLPILMLTALGEIENRITGLESGADDYLSKPFEPRELILRIHKLLERVYKEQLPKSLIKLGEFTYDISRELLYKGSEIIYLTTLENNLLKVFSAHPGVILCREELAEKMGVSLSLRTVDVQINRLRKKIEKDPKQPIYLQTVRHQGYILRSD
jgi:two-component system phosphate regulon response regulator OmpR